MMKPKPEILIQNLINNYYDQINTSLTFEDLIVLQIVGDDELFLEENHWLNFQNSLKTDKFKAEKMMPFFAKNPSSTYISFHNFLFNSKSYVDYDLIDELDVQYLVLKLNLSERKLRWIFSKDAEEKFEELFNDLKIKQLGREKIKELFFNYYVSHCFEKYFKKLKLAPNLVESIKERIFQVKEIEEQINSIIDENSASQLNHVNYVQIDTALKKARSLIRERLLGYDNKENGYHLDQFERSALILKNYFFSLSFQKGPKEHISANNLILNLYKYYSSEGPVYLPKIEKTLSWFNKNFDLGNDLKIQKFNSNSLRKRIKDLKKKENSPQENHLLRKATLSSYLYSDLSNLT